MTRNNHCFGKPRIERRRFIDIGSSALWKLAAVSAAVPITGCATIPGRNSTFLIPVDVISVFDQRKLYIDQSVKNRIPEGVGKVRLFIRTPGYYFYFSDGTETEIKKMNVPSYRINTINGLGEFKRFQEPLLGDGTWVELDRAVLDQFGSGYLEVKLYAEFPKKPDSIPAPTPPSTLGTRMGVITSDDIKILTGGGAGGGGSIQFD